MIAPSSPFRSSLLSSSAQPARSHDNGQREMSVLTPKSYEMNQFTYWLAAACIIIIYFSLWFFNFSNVYGMSIDDSTHFRMDNWVNSDWRVIFKVPEYACKYFHFIFIEAPLENLPFKLSSYNIPFADGATDKFRYLLLAATIIHIPVAIACFWFAERLFIQRHIPLIGIGLFLVSPTFVFWTPHPDGRLFELPTLFGMLWILICLNDRIMSAWRRFALQLLAGSLLFITLALNYDGLFYGACFLVMWWGLAFLHFWRQRQFWIEGCCFGAGFILCFAAGEWVGHAYAHVPWNQGHLATLLNQVAANQTPSPFIGRLSLWTDIFNNGLGLPLFILSTVGAIAFSWDKRASSLSPSSRWALVGGIGLTLCYFLAKSTFPAFRQTVGFLPILMALAALGASVSGAWITAQIARWHPQRRIRGGVVAGLILLLAALPSLHESFNVFQAQRGLGKIWRYAWKHGDGQQPWRLHFVWESPLNKPRLLTTIDDLLSGDPETRVVSWFPHDLILGGEATWMLPVLEQTKPLMAFPSPFGTNTWYAETVADEPLIDLRKLSALTEARLYRLGDLQQTIRGGPPLNVASVTADSVEGPYEPSNVFDHDTSPDDIVTWRSAEGSGPHFLEMALAEPTRLGALTVVSPVGGARIGALEVQVAGTDGSWQTAWSGSHLERQLSVDVSFPPQTVSRIRLTISNPRWPQLADSLPSPYAELDEVLFPGFSIVPPPRTRTIAQPVLDTVLPLGHHRYRLEGHGITRRTRVMANGRPVPMNFTAHQGRFGSAEIMLPPSAWIANQPLKIWLEGAGRSNILDLLSPAILTIADVSPHETIAGRGFTVRKGVSVLRVTLARSGPANAPLPEGLALTWDGRALETAFDSTTLVLTGNVPRELYAIPGHHDVAVVDTELQSRIAHDDFTVLEAPPEFKPPAVTVADFGPRETSAGQGFNLQPDGNSALSIALKPPTATNAPLPEEVVLTWDGQTLATAYDQAHLVISAAIPPNLYKMPGDHDLEIIDVASRAKLAHLNFKVR